MHCLPSTCAWQNTSLLEDSVVGDNDRVIGMDIAEDRSNESGLGLIQVDSSRLTLEATAAFLKVNVPLILYHRSKMWGRRAERVALYECGVCVFFPFILDIKFVGRTSRGHTGGSHRISHPPSFCGACLNFSREKDSVILSPRQP